MSPTLVKSEVWVGLLNARSSPAGTLEEAVGHSDFALLRRVYSRIYEIELDQ